jgi:hypothetical protein
MSLVRRRLGNYSYLYFKLPGPSEIYLGPEDRPDIPRVEKAIQYARGRLRHYEDLVSELEGLKPIHDISSRRLLDAEDKPQIETPKIEIPVVIAKRSRAVMADKKTRKRGKKR